MPKRDPDQPPPDAIPLAEAFRRFTDPKLIETLDRLEAAGANVPPREAYLSAWMNDGVPFYSTTNPRWREYQRARRAAEADFGRRLLSGELLAWGRESPWDKILLAIPPDAWAALVVVNWDKGIIRGPRPEAKRLYGVVVARLARRAKPGRKSLAEQDALLFPEIEQMLLADPTLTPLDAIWHLYNTGRVADDGGSPDSVVDRVHRRFGKFLREKYGE